MAQWRCLLFSDDSKFCLRKVHGRLRVWRRQHERIAESCVQRVIAYGGGSIMVWAGIRLGSHTQMVPLVGHLNNQRYINEILRPHVLPSAQQVGNVFIFQDDNARPHCARTVDTYLLQSRFIRLD